MQKTWDTKSRCNFYLILLDIPFILILSRSIIEENTARVNATCQTNALLLWRATFDCIPYGMWLHKIEYWLENDRARNDDIELQENLAYFRACGTDV